MKISEAIEKMSCAEQCKNIDDLLNELEADLGIRRPSAGDQGTKARMIKRQCAWCGKSMGEKPANGAAMKYGNITDGMCSSCQSEFYLEYKDYKYRQTHGSAPTVNDNDLESVCI